MVRSRCMAVVWKRYGHGEVELLSWCGRGTLMVKSMCSQGTLVPSGTLPVQCGSLTF